MTILFSWKKKREKRDQISVTKLSHSHVPNPEAKRWSSIRIAQPSPPLELKKCNDYYKVLYAIMIMHDSLGWRHFSQLRHRHVTPVPP
jgi:hypothetical protein